MLERQNRANSELFIVNSFLTTALQPRHREVIPQVHSAMWSTLADCNLRVHAPHRNINPQLSKCLCTRKLINDSPRHRSDESFCHPPYPWPFRWCFCLPIPKLHSYHTHLRISKEDAGNTLDILQPTLGISFLMMASNFDSDSFQNFDENS